jgi:hypothetical protein
MVAQKSITLKRAIKLQGDIVIILCELKTYFAPAFFDIMAHLMIHIISEIPDLGHMFL